MGRAFALSAEGWEFESPVRSSQRLNNWHVLLPWLAFTIKGLEQGWLAQCQFKVTGWGILFICAMVLQCVGTVKAGLSLDQLHCTLDLTTTVGHKYKLLIKDLKPTHSLKYSLRIWISFIS